MARATGAASYLLDYWQADLPSIYDLWLGWWDSPQPASLIDRMIRAELPGRERRELRVLDCAAGTGNPSVGLSHLGYRMTASDGSGAMLDILRTRVRSLGLGIRVLPKPVAWQILSDTTEFRGQEVVLCTGNSLCHIPPSELAGVFRNMLEVLHRGGIAIIDMKRYDAHGRELIFIGDQWIPRDRDVVHRVGEDGRAFMIESHVAYGATPTKSYTIAVRIREDGTVVAREFPVWRVTACDIRLAMRCAGFGRVKIIETPTPHEWRYDFCIGRKGRSVRKSA